MMNSYNNIARYYDTLMTNGYYDYDALASDLAQVIPNNARVLELGVGTGLMAEKLLSYRPRIDLTGIDNTEPMLEQARTRLGDEVELHLADICTFDSDEKFDVVFSCGGVWYLIDDDDDEDDELQLCSHIPNIELSRSAMRNVMRMLKPGGAFLLSIQGAHRDYETQLNDSLTYRQKIHWNNNVFHKEYIFENGKETAVQHCTYRILRHAEMENFFAGVNMHMADAPVNHFRLFEWT